MTKEYFYIKRTINGNAAGGLDIYKAGNTFHVYENDETVFVGSYSETSKWIAAWKEAHEQTAEALRKAGLPITTEYEQNCFQ